VKRLVLISLCILVVAPAEARRHRYHYHRYYPRHHVQRPVQPAVERPTERERPFEIVGHLSINRHKVVPLGRQWIRNIPVPVNLFTLDLFKAKTYE
jgi:hypothetical protein